MRRRFKILFAVSVMVLLLDQVSKIAVVRSFVPWESVPLIEGFFNLVRVHNTGAAFGFMNNPDSTAQLWFFGVAAVVAGMIIFFIAKTEKSESPLFFSALGFILGGAAGNLIDRVHYKYVVDFLDFHISGWHWPAFNVADIAICLGVFGLALQMWKTRHETEDANGEKGQ